MVEYRKRMSERESKEKENAFKCVDDCAGTVVVNRVFYSYFKLYFFNAARLRALSSQNEEEHGYVASFDVVFF